MTIHHQILNALWSAVQRLPSIDYGEEKLNRWGPITATIKYIVLQQHHLQFDP
jgi:hypothetical protein